MKIKFVGLIFSCPLGLHSSDCVFSEIRETKSILERFSYWENMTDQQIYNLINVHWECFRKNNSILNDIV